MPRLFGVPVEVPSCSGMLLSTTPVLASQFPRVVEPAKPAAPLRLEPRLVPRALDRLAPEPGEKAESI